MHLIVTLLTERIQYLEVDCECILCGKRFNKQGGVIWQRRM